MIAPRSKKNVIGLSRNNFPVVICFFLLFLYILPMIILQEDSHVSIHDNLNSEVMYRVIPVKSGQALNLSMDARINSIMNGIPRYCFPTGLNVVMLLFLLFKPFTAYLINETILRIIAFIGMALLLKKHFLREENDKWIIAGTALCFAMLPYYSIFGLTIAGQPLLLFAFLNLFKKETNFRNYIIILGYPFYSVLVFSGIFIIFTAGIIWIYDVYRKRKFNYPFLLGIVLLGVMYVIAEYQLFYSMLISSGYISHRVEFDPSFWSFNGIKAVKKILINFFWGHYHSLSLHYVISIIIVPAALIIGYIKKINLKILLSLVLIAFGISLFYGIYRSNLMVPLKMKYSLLKEFQFDRFYFLQTTIWYLLFALALKIIASIGIEKKRLGAALVTFAIVLQILIIFNYTDTKKQAEKKNDFLALTGITDHVSEKMTFREFYAEGLFTDIRDFIGRPQSEYRVVSVALQPAIAAYNGFFTLDMYMPNYPLEYKHRFRKVIARELAKNKKHRDTFDKWGHICYIYVSEINDIQKIFTKKDTFEIKNLELDTDQLKAMGGKYIFSAVEVLNYRENNLKLLKIFEKDKYPWRIYLYKVK